MKQGVNILNISNNTAYDFGVFEEQKQKKSGQVIKLPSKNKKAKIKKKERLLFWFKIISAVVFFGVVFAAFLYGQAILTEYTHRISVYSKELDDLKNTNNQLELKLVSEKLDINNTRINNKNTKSVEHIIINAGDVSKVN